MNTQPIEMCSYTRKPMKHDIPCMNNLRNWVNYIKTFRYESRRSSEKNKINSSNFKFHVIELYTQGSVS